MEEMQPCVAGQPFYATAHNIKSDSIRYFGHIKIFYPTKGYGFILSEGGKELYFDRKSLCKPNPKIGTKVSFSIKETSKGMVATKINWFEIV